jgi:TonB-linked SusC/RagA family outer membrane protein
MKFLLLPLLGQGGALTGALANPKIRFLMRVSLFISILLALSLQLSAFDTNAQSIDRIEVTLEFKNAKLAEVLAKIEASTRITFIYTPEQINAIGNITLASEKRTVKKLLDLVLAETDLTYKEDEGTVIIYRGRLSGDGSIKTGSVDVSSEASLYAIVKGTVRDKNSEPLVGVNILVKNSTTGTASQTDGTFAIAADLDETLVFSFIGFKTLEVPINGRMIIDVVLEDDIATLREVTINGGYYNTTEKLKTGSIVKVESKDIERQPVTNPLMALQGRVAGLDITPTNGVPGNSVKIRIRGENSLRANGGYPLYIIDGVQIDSRPLESGSGSLLGPFDPISTINPSNIESIEVLKDGDATAIYGSKGANGVILITTKTARAGEKTNVDVSFYSGVGKIANTMDLLNTQQYLTMREEAFANDGATPDENNAPDLVLWDNERYTDWQKILLGGTSNITDINGNITAGNDNTSFRFGGGYHKETLVFPGDFKYQRASASFNLNHASNDKKFRVTLAVNYGVDKNNLFSDFNLVNSALNLAPNAPALHDEDGNLNWELNSSGARTWTNPLSAIEKTHDATTNNLVANSVISYELLNGLILKSSFGFTDLRNKELLKIPFSSMTPEDKLVNKPENTFGNNNRQSWIIEPQLVYTKQIGKHGLNVIIGTTWQKSTSEYSSINAQGYTSDALLGALQWAATTRVIAEGVNEYKYNSVFARLGYNYDDKYLLNVTARRDGSSRFGPDKRFGNFGAIGAAWIFSNEGFISNQSPWLSFGKLRASYGVTGNDQIGDYQYYNYYVKTGTNYDDQIGINPSALLNPDYQWEQTKKLETALELGFVDNRISFEAILYRNRSDNQLINYDLPATAGFPSVLQNFGATVQNAGLEVILNAQNVVKDDFMWSTSINFTLPKNKLVEFQDIEETPYGTVYKVGESLSIQRLYNWQHVNPQTGLHQFEDINDNGSIDNGDLQFMMPLDRKYYGGIVNTLRYKAFELSFLFQFSRGYSAVYMSEGLPGILVNQPVEIMDRWQNEGDISDVQKFNQDLSAKDNYSDARRSNYQYTDGSFLRLKTLSLSYVFPSSIVSKARLQDARIYLQGQNLITYTDYLTLDPETGTGLPQLKLLTMGIQIKL